MVSLNDRWVKESIAIGGAVLLMLLLDWLLPGSTILPDIVNLSWEKIKYIGIAIMVLMLVTILGVGWALKGEIGREEVTKEALTRAYVDILHRLRKRRAIARIIGDWFELRDPTLPGELPIQFKKLRVEIYTMINWMLRHEIYAAKHRSVEEMVHDFGDHDVGREKTLTRRTPTFEQMNFNMRQRLEGGKIQRADQNDPSTDWQVVPNTELRMDTPGFANQYYIILKLMNILKNNLATADLKKPKVFEALNPEQSIPAVFDREHFSNFTENIERNYGRFKTAVRRFRVVNKIRAQWLYFLDMYNLYGEYKRGFRFAKMWSVPQLYRVVYDPMDPNFSFNIDHLNPNPVVREIDWDKLRLGVPPIPAYQLTPSPPGSPPDTQPTITNDAPNFTTANYYYPNFELDDNRNRTHYLIETDTYGFSVSDINRIQIDKIDLPYIRKWKASDIGWTDKPDEEVPRFNLLMHSAELDWRFFLEDFEKGIYHSFSKKIDDYNELIAYGYTNFDAATFKSLLTIEQNAFDREMLKDTGKFTYWGRRHYWDYERSDMRNYPVNPYPAVSFYPLWNFITSVTTKIIKEPEIARRFIEEFKLGYREIEKQTQPRQGGGGSAH